MPNDDPLSAERVGRLPSISSASAAPAIDSNGPVEHSFRPFPAAWLDRSVFSVLCETAAAHADKVALDDGETCLTYRELRERVEALAAYLAVKVGRGAVVGIALPNGTLYPVAMLAVLAAGCTYVPLDLTFPEQRNAYILKHSAMKAIVVDASTREQVARMSAALPQVEIERVTPGSGPAPVSTPEDIALIIYTSGSTGNPKGVYFTQRDLLHHLLQRTNWSHMSANDRVLLLYAPTVSVAQQDIFSPLLAGATLYVVDIRRKGLKEVVEVMRRARITMYHSVPYLFRLLLELCHEDAPFASVRTVFLSSDRIFSSDVELFRRRFPARSCFGLAMGSSETFVYGHWFIPNDEPLEDALVPVGYALPDYQISVVDDAGAPVPRGELGELVIAGRYISLGYWNDAEQSRRAFSTSADDPAIRVYRTGDLGRMRADGLLELIGRIDRQIKIRGHRVEPAEVEATIRTNPVVGDVSVIAFGEGAAVELVAYVAAAPGATLSQAALSEWMTAHLSDAMRPRKLRFVPEIPMLGNFKHDIPRLRAMERERALAAGGEGTKAPAPPTPPAAPSPPAAAKRLKRAEPPAVREAVRAAWTRVVGAKSFDADMTWAQAGGDSLQALNFVFALEAALHRPMPESTLSPATRPSDIIAKLQNGALDRRAPGAAGPPLFLFPGVVRNVISAANLADELRAAGYDAHLLSYPPIDADHVGFVDFRSHIDYVLTQIRAVLADDAPVRVLGWSFGGFVAFEVACLLAAEGRKIEFVGVVDLGPYAVARDQSWFATESPLRRLARAVAKGRFVRLLNPHYLSSRLIEEQLRRRMFGLLHWEWRLVDAIGWPRARRKFAVNVARFIRMRATRGLQISYFAGPVHLFRCRERTFGDAFGHNENPEADIDTPRDMSWGPYCTRVSIAEVPGNHNTPFEPKNLPESLRVILAALRGENEDAERPAATTAPSADTAPAPSEPRADDAVLRKTVRAVWSGLVGAASFDANASWEQAEGDSLKGMELAWGLEEALGHPVPITIIDPATRPSDLIARLKAGTDAPRPHAVGSAARQRPRLFFLPGTLGPDFNTKRFADALAGDYDVETLDYLAVDPNAIRVMTFEEIALDVARRIDAKVAKDETVHIVGYSLGALITQFVAYTLANKGRRIGFVGFLDTGPVMLGHLPYFLTNETILKRLLRTVRRGELARRSVMRPFGLLVERQLRTKRFRLLAWEWRAVTALGLRRAALLIRLAAIRYVRTGPAHAHVPPFYAGSVHVFRGGDSRWEELNAGDDLNWRRCCAEVATWKVSGDHMNIFDVEHVQSVTSAVTQAFRETLGSSAAKTARQLAG